MHCYYEVSAVVHPFAIFHVQKCALILLRKRKIIHLRNLPYLRCVMKNGMQVLIGCDGVHSRVARWLGLGEPVNSGRSAVRGLSIFPQGHQFDHDFTRFVDVSFNGAFVPLTDTELFWGLVVGNSAPLGNLPIYLMSILCFKASHAMLDK